MKTPFYYILKAKLVRIIEGNEIVFLEFEESFKDDNPILARENVFYCYQNYVDVLLQSINKKYSSEKQVREELMPFIGPNTNLKKLDFKQFDSDFLNESYDTFEYGIGILMKVDEKLPNLFHSGDLFFIHGIGLINSFNKDIAEKLIYELDAEYKYYKYYNFDIKYFQKDVIFCDPNEWEQGYRENEPSTYTILETPFDWDGYDKPFWWGKQNNEIPELNLSPIEFIPSIKEMLKIGENNQIEFKPTLLYNFKTGKAGLSVKYIIAKTICSFLNSNGGCLLIGVKDNKEILGLEHDFNLAENKDAKDFFLLEFDDMLRYFLTFSIKSNISCDFVAIDDKEVFRVIVKPNKYKPVFLNGKEDKEFYVRGEASSIPIKDIEVITNYCLEKWAK